MVYYFQSTVVSPPAFIYVGKDKVESMPGVYNLVGNAWAKQRLDEDLIRFGWEEDVW
jgi:hypothetical protein